MGELSAMLDYRRLRPARLFDALELDDLELIAALAGSRRDQLRKRWRQFDRDECRASSEQICSHRSEYPSPLRCLRRPPALLASSSVDSLVAMARAPSVALTGGEVCSAQGAQVASSLARSLASAEVAVIASAAHELGRVALSACAAAGGRCVAVLAREPRSRDARCEISEFPRDLAARPWMALAGERLVAALAQVTVIVEARDEERDLLAARVARSLERPLGATPGLITNPFARGPHQLIDGGARLVGAAEDVLELLPSSKGDAPSPTSRAHNAVRVEKSMGRVLSELGAGAATLEQLIPRAGSSRAVLGALGELEALGLIDRATDGRYLAR